MFGLLLPYVTPDQTAKSVVKFLWQGYISIFGVLAKLLSDQGATFESNIFSKLCDLMDIQKVRTTSRPMDRWSKPTKCWCGWLGNWVKIGRQTGISIYQNWCMHTTPQDRPLPGTAHYLMFGQWLCLPIDFYFPTIVSTEKHQHVNHYIADLCKWLSKAFKEAQAQSSSKADRQRQYYDCKANAISLEPGDMVLAKPDANKGRKKVKDCWKKELYEVEHRIAEGIPSYLVKNQQTRCSQVLNWKQLLLIIPIMGAPLCTGVQAEQTRCATTILEEPTQKASEHEKVPQSAKCLPLAQHQTGETPLGQVKGSSMCSWECFPEPPCQTKGEKFNVEERGYVDVNVSILDAEVLITPMKLQRCDWSWFLQSHLSSF